MILRTSNVCRTSRGRQYRILDQKSKRRPCYQRDLGLQALCGGVLSSRQRP